MKVLYRLSIVILICAWACAAFGFDYTFSDYADKSNQSSDQYCYHYTFLDKDSETQKEMSHMFGVCGQVAELESRTGTQSTAPNTEDKEAVSNASILPDPGVQSVEDYMLDFGTQGGKETIFLGGIVPFVALPDSNLVTNDSFLNQDSVSFFLYFKRKF